MSDRARREISPHWVVMGVLFAAALFVGYELVPGQVQRVAMLERDGQANEARDVLERSYAEGDRSPRTLLQLQALYEQLGQLDKARDLLGQLLARSPRDANILKRAANFYKVTQDEPAYTATLQTQLDLKYSEAACRELIGLLRLQGNALAEQAAIQSCRQRGYRRAEDLVRLAQMVAVDGDLPQASTILRTVDDLRRLKTDRERGILTATLLELDQPREAYRRALRWLRGGREVDLALTIIDQMAVANQHDLGIELAREISVPGDAISLAVAELWLDRGQPLAAKSYLRGWIEQAKAISDNLISRFIIACLDAEDPDNAMVGAQRFGLDKLTQPDLVALAEALAATGRQAAFDAVRASIEPDVLADNPLLAAAVALQRGAPEATKNLLSTVAVDELDEWRLSLWARLMNRTGRTAAATVALQRLGVEPAQVATATVPQTAAQTDRVIQEPQLIRRPKRQLRARFRRLPPGVIAARAAKQPPPLAPPFAPLIPAIAPVPGKKGPGGQVAPSPPSQPFDFSRGG